MNMEELLAQYLPMSRLLSYVLLGLTEPMERSEVCQTVSELSEGEFDDVDGFTGMVDVLVDELLAKGLLEELVMGETKVLVTTSIGSKLLVCEFNRRRWFEKEKENCQNFKKGVDNC